jgi:hypothetical protein
VHQLKRVLSSRAIRFRELRHVDFGCSAGSAEILLRTDRSSNDGVAARSLLQPGSVVVTHPGVPTLRRVGNLEVGLVSVLGGGEAGVLMYYCPSCSVAVATIRWSHTMVQLLSWKETTHPSDVS